MYGKEARKARNTVSFRWDSDRSRTVIRLLGVEGKNAGES